MTDDSKSKCRVVVLFLGIVSILIPTSRADDLNSDWPQWRGPKRDGQTAGPNWPDRLDERHLQPVWRKELGPGYSGPIIGAGRVFVTETINRSTERVQALEVGTGKELWKAAWAGAMDVPFFAKANGDWIRATPAYDGQSLFVAGMRDVLVRLDADTGAERWRIDFVNSSGTPVPAFGFVSSPLVVGDHLYVQAGAAFVRIDKHTGHIQWRSLKDDGGMSGSAFSSPVRAQIAGMPQLIVQTRERLAGVDETSGKELWSIKVEAFRGMNILTPTLSGDSVLTSTYGGKTQLLEVKAAADGFTVSPRWSNKAQGYMSSPILINGYAYLHLRNQRFTCIELATGKETWTTKPYGKYWSMIAQGDRILALDERGDLLLIRADPQKFDLIDSRKISDASTWAHIAVSGPRLYVRDLNGIAEYVWQPPIAGK